MKRLLLASALIGLLGTATASDSGKLASVHSVVKESLTYPDAAHFRNVRIINGIGCGEVNPKEAEGYVGFIRFMVEGSFITFEEHHETHFEEWWRQHCGN